MEQLKMIVFLGQHIYFFKLSSFSLPQDYFWASENVWPAMCTDLVTVPQLRL